jgi:hypothetical protein
VSGLQSETTVPKLLKFLGQIAKHEHVELEVGKTKLRLRALVSDHTLHDLGAPLVGAFRAAAQLGAQGELLFAIDSTPPSLVHRLRLRSTSECRVRGRPRRAAVENRPRR